MKEVSGTQITVTKKATVIKLDKQPPVENNNLQELFTKAPGLLVSEQQNPGQFNFTYRGLGNPQESELTTFLQDGLPLASDWIGFPTLYYLPLPQSVSEVQLIRGAAVCFTGRRPRQRSTLLRNIRRLGRRGTLTCNKWEGRTGIIPATVPSRRRPGHSKCASMAATNIPTGSGTTASTICGRPTAISDTARMISNEFNNGGVDVRFRKKWGDDTMFRGSALTFGGVVYHGDAPFTRYLLDNTDLPGGQYLYAPRGTTSANLLHFTLDQSRTADYQAFFIEDLFRLGSFYIVPSFRLDHENVEVDSTHAPYVGMGPPQSISADHWVPLWGIGLGNDFGKNNETYFSATTGWRPTRFFDIAGTSRTISPGADIPDPFESLDIELGVHGTPIKGLWYDALRSRHKTEAPSVA